MQPFREFPRFFLIGLLVLQSWHFAEASSSVQIQFPEPALQIEVGQTRVISFLRKDRDPAAAQYDISVSPAEQIEVLMPGKILAEQPVGYLRIRGVKPGKAVLKMGGKQLELSIVAEAKPKLVVEPRIVTPIEGAVVWGEIAVAAECFVPDQSPTTAILRLPDGTELFPQPLPQEEVGPGRHFVFLVDTARLKPGENELKLETLLEGQPPVAAEPLRIRVIAPKTEEIIAGECEDSINTPRSERYKEKIPLTAKDDTASGGVCVKNASSEPVWLTTVEIKQAGEYQMMIVSRGDAALGAYPTVMLQVDDQRQPLTNGRVSDKVWRRNSLGRPMHLDAGAHTLGVRFDNDFAEGKVDRNLYLDRYELTRVADKPAETADSESESTMMTSAAPTMTMAAADPAAELAGFKINFTQLFDLKTIGGPVNLLAKCQLENKNSTHFPEVGLWLNGRKIATETGPSLIFTIDPANFQTGNNSLQLRAQDSAGNWIESAPQRLILNQPTLAASRAIQYFTVFDRAWDPEMTKRYELTDGKRLADTAAWYGNGEAVLHLPDSLVGSFDFSLLAKGQYFQGAPIAELVLRVKGVDAALLKTEIKGDWSEIRPGKLELPAGPKDLVVRFINDASDGNKGDRNFWLRWVKFTASSPNTSLSDSRIALAYWPKLQPVGLSDAVVANVFANEGMTVADLVIDDVPQKLAVDISSGLNPIILPLLTRSFKPGSHRMQVVCSNDNGEKVTSEIQEINVSSKREPDTGSYAQAVRLLDRFGFGANPIDLAPLLVAGPEKWLADSFTEDPEQRSALRDAVNQKFSGQNPNDNLVQHVLHESSLDPNPVRQRFVLWAENHFSTWIEKTGKEKKRREHEAFARMGVASFPDLLLTSATSPAMLVYLDQQRSFAGRINENYAREIMELHTLGVKGGYSQTDVTALAGLLTGWSMAEQGDLEGSGGDLVGEFRYDPNLNSGAPTQILGLEFPQAAPGERFGRVQMALDTLAAYPSTGLFISRKLAEHYLSDPAPDKLVQNMARVFARTDGDMAALLRTMATSPEFAVSPRRIATPLDFCLRVSRAAGGADPGAMADFLRRSGMGLFDHTSPDGYPQEDANYVSSNALMQRWRFGQKIEGPLLSLFPKTWRYEKTLTLEQTQQMLDLAATRLLGSCLSETSNQAAMELLAKAQPTGDARSRLIVNFLCQTPEAGLR